MRLTDLLILVLIGLLMILLLPVILPLAVYSFIKNKIDKRRFESYLLKNDGATFFAYTDKTSSRKYVEDNLLPHLPDSARVFHLGGKKGRYNMGEDFGLLAHVVGTMRETKGGFPYISKIVAGELLTESINNQLYSAIRRGVDADAIIKRVIKFYTN